MQTWTNQDKSAYKQRGEWDNEPDKAQWISHNLDCLIVRSPSTGALCGYVGVPETHPLFGKSYDDADVSVHGGLTFANRCHPSDDPGHNICHTEPFVNKTVWWLGFDCAHCDDIAPRFDTFYMEDAKYRNLAYVRAEVEQLAKQLASLQ